MLSNRSDRGQLHVEARPVREQQSLRFHTMPVRVGRRKVSQDLPHLGTTEEVLLVAQEEIDERFAA